MKNKINKAVILCGGYGTRLMPITKSVPKEMLPILDKPILQIIVEQLVNAKIKNILIIIGRNKDIIVNHFDRNIELEALNNLPDSYYTSLQSANIYFKRQGIAKGTGHALLSAKTFVGNQPFLMCFGDEIFFSKTNIFEQMIEEYKNTSNNVIAMQQVDLSQVDKYGILSIKQDKDKILVDDFIEKPNKEHSPSNLAYNGVSIFNSEIFKALNTINSQNNEIRLTDAFYQLIAEKKLYAKELTATIFDIGSTLGLLQANIYAGLNDPNIKNQLTQFLGELKLS